MTLEYQLTFAGIPFVLDTAKVVRMAHRHPEVSSADSGLAPLKHQPLEDLVDELDRMIPFKYLQDFSLPPTYPGRNLGGIAFQGQPDPQPNPDVHIGDWYYPYSACRWSVFRGLATSSQAKAMLAATAGYQPAMFTMAQNPIAPYHQDSDSASYSLSSAMRLLPPRPLAEHGPKFDGLYLITLVDERYYFQGTPVSLHVTPGTSWLDLLAQLATALGINFTVDPIPTAYSRPEPDSPLWMNFEQAAILLDAVAYNIGTIIVRGLDGTYTLQKPAASQAIVNNNRGAAQLVARVAGGDIFTTGEGLPIGNLTAARNAVVPSKIIFTYPKYVYGDDPVPHFLNSRYANQRPSAWIEQSYGDVYSYTVPISMGGPSVTGLTGVSELTIRDTAKALYPTEAAAAASAPSNLAGLAALALQEAQDYYEAQVLSALDEVYPGTFAWQPEGLHDIIWTYSARSRRACTRVMRDEWNTPVAEMQHATPPYSAGTTSQQRGVGGLSVAQTVRDQVSGTLVTTNLRQTFLAGNTFAVFNQVACLPTQNRWRGKVDDEVILFEGTSGGLAGRVDVAYRGYDGTLAADHINGRPVTYLIPNTSYGTNLVSWEKNQWVHPAEHTSGGIQGARVVPQTQTVEVIQTAGPGVQTGLMQNGITYWSGSVTLFDTKLPGFQKQELCWVVERNSQDLTPGKRYDGTYTGPSAVLGSPPFPTSPVYLVDAGEDLGCDIKPTNCLPDCGTSEKAAREDHVHNLTFGTKIQSVGTANLVGMDCLPARSDHVHKTRFGWPGFCSSNVSWIETDTECLNDYLVVFTRTVTLTFDTNGCPGLDRGSWFVWHYAGCCTCTGTPPPVPPDICLCCGCPIVPEFYLFTVSGITGGGACGTSCVNFNSDWTLLYQGLCIWDSGDVSPCNPLVPSWTLSCDGVNWNLVPGTSGGTLAIAYQLAVASWDCIGDNILTLATSVSDCSGWPASITITASLELALVSYPCAGVPPPPPPVPPVPTGNCGGNCCICASICTIWDAILSGITGGDCCDLMNGVFVLTQQSATCRWTSAAIPGDGMADCLGDGGITLTCAGNTAQLTVTLPNGTFASYSGAINCTGPTTLSFGSQGGPPGIPHCTWPATITIQPDSACGADCNSATPPTASCIQCCACPEATLCSIWDVIVSNVTGGGSQAACCTGINATWSVPLRGAGSCTWFTDLSLAGCSGSPSYIDIQCTGPTITVTILLPNGTFAVYGGPVNCSCDAFTVPFDHQGGPNGVSPCTWPATIILQPDAACQCCGGSGTPSFNCVAGVCVDPGDGSGAYATSALCLAAGCGTTPITVSCCALGPQCAGPDCTVPNILHVSLSGTACAGFTGSPITLTYNSATGSWDGFGNGTLVRLNCSGGNWNFQMVGTCTGNASAGGPTGTCNPMNLTFTGSGPPNGCCPAGYSFTAVITP